MEIKPEKTRWVYEASPDHNVRFDFYKSFETREDAELALKEDLEKLASNKSDLYKVSEKIEKQLYIPYGNGNGAWYSESELAALQNCSKVIDIIKIYGDYRDPENVIFTHQHDQAPENTWPFFLGFHCTMTPAEIAQYLRALADRIDHLYKKDGWKLIQRTPEDRFDSDRE